MIELHLAQLPPVTYDLWVTPMFCMQCTGKVPSRFHRWAMTKVFGFRFNVRTP